MSLPGRRKGASYLILVANMTVVTTAGPGYPPDLKVATFGLEAKGM
jgi:hypothetical protein